MSRNPGKRLTQKQILNWADLHFERTGRWPAQNSGRVREAPEQTWQTIDGAFRYGRFGLPGGGSLHHFLKRKRGKPEGKYGSRMWVKEILDWADAHHERTGSWPNQKSGAVRDVPGATWQSIDAALRHGLRGLPGGSSLPLLLAEYRRKQHHDYPPRLTIKQILQWADDFKRRTGRWPSQVSGRVHRQRNLTWKRIHESLYHGQRGLKGGSSLAKLLDQYRRGTPTRKRGPV